MENNLNQIKDITVLDELKEIVNNCKNCKLHTTRTNVVFGEGNKEADVLFIGEGPGKEEDLQARPFVGRSGALLTAIIEKGMEVPRNEVYIANIVKCRPTVDMQFTRDRAPEEDEVKACCAYLKKQIDIIKPKVIITLGNPSTRFILSTKIGITKLRGKWHYYNNIPVMPTFHPSYVLRNGGEKSPLKREVWNDIKLVIKFLETGELDGEKREKISTEKIENKIEIHQQQNKKNTTQGNLF